MLKILNIKSLRYIINLYIYIYNKFGFRLDDFNPNMYM